MITFGSLFAGIGGFDLGFERAGMHCAWQVEIDNKCNEVLNHHWPDVQRYGDVKDVGKQNLEPVDLVVGGFPCQDVSVAGRREGLDGERSGLWFEFIRIVEELRPKWVVVENVPGLLSSNEKRDFAVILSGLGECGYWWAYRVLDAQNYGVPQRRRRVFVVGCLGKGRAQEILFERESSPWDIAPSRETGKELARDVAACIKGGSGQRGFPIEFEAGLAVFQESQYGVQGYDNAGSLRAGRIPEHQMIIAESLNANAGRGQEDHETFVLAVGENQRGEVCLTPYNRALKVGGGKPGQGYPCVLSFRTNQTGAQGPIHSEELTDTLAQDHPPAIAFTHSGYSNKPAWITGDRTDAIPSAGHHPSSHQGIGIIQSKSREHLVLETAHRGANQTGIRKGTTYPVSGSQAVLQKTGIRRLTPLECERLQGFPDNWTAVNGMSDSARYRMLGNAVCVPVAKWIAQRIVKNEGEGNE